MFKEQVLIITRGPQIPHLIFQNIQQAGQEDAAFLRIKVAPEHNDLVSICTAALGWQPREGIKTSYSLLWCPS